MRRIGCGARSRVRHCETSISFAGRPKRKAFTFRESRRGVSRVLLFSQSGPRWVGAVGVIAAGTGIFILIRVIGEGTRILTTGAAGFDF